jgi:YihY family inner membrane protein
VTRNQYVAFARSLGAVVRDQQLSFLAAAIAYYAFVSAIPIVLVTLAVATAVAGPVVATQVIGLFGDLLTPAGRRLVETALTSGSGRSGATAVGLVVLLWSSLRLFRGLDIAFSRVYRSEEVPSLVGQVRDALVVVGAIAAGLGATVALGAVVPLAWAPLVNVVGSLVLVVALSVVFFPMYYVFPNRRVGVREAVPGAVLAAGGWTLLGTAFGIYARQAATFQLYGVVGGVLLLLTWFYFGGLLLLLGAALNATLARGDRQLQQGALRDDTQRMSDPDGHPVDADEDADEENGDEDVATVEPESVDYEDFAALRRELEELEADIENRTVHREKLEADLRRYVRRRARRGHARGWGPYLVLLYGTVMTVGAFYFLAGVWAVLAMIVVWLSTLGLYALMVVVGTATAALGVPGRAIEFVRKLRP